MKTIEFCRRNGDYWTDEKGQRQSKFHAQIKDEPGVWGCGKTIDEAIGSLINSHPGKFQIELKDLGQRAR